MMKKEEHKKRVRFWKDTDGFSFGAQLWKTSNGDGYTSGIEFLFGRWTMVIRLREKTPTPPWTPSEWAEFLDGFFEGHEAPEWAKEVMKAAGIESKSEGEVDKPLIQSDTIKGSSSGTISCDTKSTEERKFSGLETEVEDPEIRTSAASDAMPGNECDEVDETWTTYAEYVNRPESEK